MSRKQQLEAAYKAVVEEINSYCSTNRYPVPNLVAVSKYHAVEDIQTLYDLGHRHFGENYVQELTLKAKALPKDINWHFIGNLQSNKTKIVGEIPNLTTVETVDSMSKATRLNNHRGELGMLDVYIQINTSKEPQKAGLSDLEEIYILVNHIILSCPALRLRGFMTIGSFAESKADGENPDFTALRETKDFVENKLGYAKGLFGLSMGMSSDYIQAIRQGSTNIRVGSNIFGARPTKEEVKESKEN